jgi:hypothetical protein
MADRKISDLTALTTPASGDYLPIVDISEASAANKNKRITIEELLRGAPDGTAAAPGIAFESDPNTGIYSPGADAFGVVTAGTERLRITSDGKVGIGTTSPAATLHSRSDNAGSGSTPLLIQNRSVSANTAVGISFAPNTSDTADRSAIIYGVNSSGGSGNATDLAFHTNANGGSPTEKARIDSSGRLLVGTSSQSGGSLLQVNDNRIRIATAKTPASATDTGVAGEICWDANYVYVCTATNTWKRTAISTW